MQRITVAAVQVTKGDYGTEVDLRKSNDEIGLLADSFNEMSRKMASDIENLRQMNEQLVRADKLAAMGTLAAGVAHEVNNPLASISSLIQMMRSENGSEDMGERLEMISDADPADNACDQGPHRLRPRPARRQSRDGSLVASSKRHYALRNSIRRFKG